MPENIRFDFTASYYDSFKTIEVDAILYNDNPYTVYFLYSSCYGAKSNLLYDKLLLGLAGTIWSCNATYPVKDSIAAYALYKIHEHFGSGQRIINIKLGYEFSGLSADFDSKPLWNFELKNKTELWAERTIRTQTAYHRSHVHNDFK